jgi:hypothetical protein
LLGEAWDKVVMENKANNTMILIRKSNGPLCEPLPPVTQAAANCHYAKRGNALRSCRQLAPWPR